MLSLCFCKPVQDYTPPHSPSLSFSSIQQSAPKKTFSIDRSILTTSTDSGSIQPPQPHAHDINAHHQVIELNFNAFFIAHLPKDIFKLHTLTTLMLNQNYFTTLPEEIQSLPIITLHLSSNRFNKLPYLPHTISTLTLDLNPLDDITGIHQYTNLTDLHLNSCDLTTLPEDISALTNLTHLALHENYLLTIPNSIKALTNLTKLSLHNNNLHTLPSQLTALQSLTWLSLHFNAIQTLPDPFIFPQLQRLSLHQNRLTTLPPSFNQCTALKVISLFRNQLQHLPQDVFTPLTNLQKLSIHQNPDLTNIDIPHLEELWVDENVNIQDVQTIEKVNLIKL